MMYGMDFMPGAINQSRPVSYTHYLSMKKGDFFLLNLHTTGIEIYVITLLNCTEPYH